MIKHIVMWRLKETAEGHTRSENAARAKELLEALGDEIEAIRTIQAGVDVLHGEASYDLALYSEFADLDALAEYQAHPEHQKIVSFMGAIAAERAVVDYEVAG